jgi:uncharacterized protein YndB with AHSA1/START domain
MIKINSSTIVNRRPVTVFDFTRNQENAQSWLTGLLETRPTATTQGVGFTWVDVIEVFGRRVETEFEVTAFEPPHKLAFKSIRGSFPIHGTYTFAEVDEGTAVTFALQDEPGGFFKLAEPLLARMLQRQWDTNLANLKDVLESSQ